MADIRSNGWEWLHYDNPDFQVMFRHNHIPANIVFEGMTSHWHDDVELLYVLSGSTYYVMENENLKINAGEGIFVNAGQRHVIKASDEDCELDCLIFHPHILCSNEYISDNVVFPILKNPNIKYVKLSDTVEWQKRILADIVEMEDNERNEIGAMNVMKLVFDIWECLYENLTSRDKKNETSRDMSSFGKMVEYIHENYRSKILLTDICKAGNVGRTKCNSLFADNANLTPLDYVRNYRLEKSAEMLRLTDMSVTDIAFENGFSDGSYFTKVFGQQIGCSPLEYRKYSMGLNLYYEKGRN